MFGKHHQEVVIINEQIIIVEGSRYHRAETRLAFTSLQYHSLIIKNSIIMSVQLNVKEIVKGTLGLVNHLTGEAIPGVTFANETAESSDNGILQVNVDSDAPDTVDVVGLAPGTADIIISADASYSDPNTNQPVTENKKLKISGTITPAPVQTDLVVSFGQPTPIS